jgi:hypothetical protein
MVLGEPLRGGTGVHDLIELRRSSREYGVKLNYIKEFINLFFFSADYIITYNHSTAPSLIPSRWWNREGFASFAEATPLDPANDSTMVVFFYACWVNQKKTKKCYKLFHAQYLPPRSLCFHAIIIFLHGLPSAIVCRPACHQAFCITVPLHFIFIV